MKSGLNNINNLTLSGTSSGATHKSVFVFLDGYGNVDQFKKHEKNAPIKYYPDAKSLQDYLAGEPCIIAISGDKLSTDPPQCVQDSEMMGVSDIDTSYARYL
jgi:hypothetical protein